VSKQHMKLSVGVLVIVASVAYLIVSGATGKTMYFLTVPEVQQQLTTLTGAPLRVAGKVTADPIEWDVRHLSLGRCLTGVDSRSKRAPEFVAIDEQPNDEIVHALCLGEAQCATH
jgi:cytochrome c-type biogenesis protein CcmE